MNTTLEGCRVDIVAIVVGRTQEGGLRGWMWQVGNGSAQVQLELETQGPGQGRAQEDKERLGKQGLESAAHKKNGFLCDLSYLRQSP